MNKLITTYDGGFKLKMNDFEWMQQSIIDALKGAVSPLMNGNDPVILSGIKIENGIFGQHTTAGYLYKDGEIFFCPQTPNSAIIVGADRYIEIIEDYDPDGMKNFKDGQSHNTYQINVARVTSYQNPPTGAILLSSIRRLNASLQLVKSQNISVGHTYPGNYNIYAKRNMINEVCMYGSLWCEDLQQNDVLFTLPSEFSSSRVQNFMLFDLEQENAIVQIQIDGLDVKFVKFIGNNQYNVVLNFDGVVFV